MNKESSVGDLFIRLQLSFRPAQSPVYEFIIQSKKFTFFKSIFLSHYTFEPEQSPQYSLHLINDQNLLGWRPTSLLSSIVSLTRPQRKGKEFEDVMADRQAHPHKRLKYLKTLLKNAASSNNHLQPYRFPQEETNAWTNLSGTEASASRVRSQWLLGWLQLISHLMALHITAQTGLLPPRTVGKAKQTPHPADYQLKFA